MKTNLYYINVNEYECHRLNRCRQDKLNVEIMAREFCKKETRHLNRSGIVYDIRSGIKLTATKGRSYTCSV